MKSNYKSWIIFGALMIAVIAIASLIINGSNGGRKKIEDLGIKVVAGAQTDEAKQCQYQEPFSHRAAKLLNFTLLTWDFLYYFSMTSFST